MTVAGCDCLGILQQTQGAVVASPERTERYSRGTVSVLWFRTSGQRVEYDLQGLVETLKVRNQDLHSAIGHEFADLANGFGKNSRAAQVVVIAIHAGHDGVLQSESGDGFSHAAGFVPLDGARLALGHGAKAAAPGTDIAQQHECRGAMVPALADIGTLRRLAHRVQAQAASQFFEIVKVFADRGLGPEPLRLGLPDGGAKFDLHQLGRGCHCMLGFYMQARRFPKANGRARSLCELCALLFASFAVEGLTPASRKNP